ncbi:MAG: extracellular solute-binding protein [Propionibacteriaceae bacterium]|nr:extracellular solute-binding protein [Propionibacteriaceae bacterium]
MNFLSGWQVGDGTGNFLAAAVEAFAKVQPDITVNVETVKFDDLKVTVETESVANEMPDLITMNFTGENKPWLDDGLIADTTSYLTDWGITDKLLPGVTDAWAYNGKLGGFPYQTGSWPMWYNMDLLKAAGVSEVPTTIDALKDAATKLKANGVAALCYPGKDWGGAGFFWLIDQLYTGAADIQGIMQNGGFAASDAAQQGIDLLGDLRDSGVLIDNAAGYGYEDCANAYDQSKVAMAFFGSWSFTQISEPILKVTQLGGFPLPDGAAFDKPIAFATGGNGILMSQAAADDPAKVAAIKAFMDFLYSKDALQLWISDPGNQIAAVTSEASGPSTSTNVMLQQNATLWDVAEPATLQDLYVKSGVDITPEITWFIGTQGATAADLAPRLDALWQD